MMFVPSVSFVALGFFTHLAWLLAGASLFSFLTVCCCPSSGCAVCATGGPARQFRVSISAASYELACFLHDPPDVVDCADLSGDYFLDFLSSELIGSEAVRCKYRCDFTEDVCQFCGFELWFENTDEALDVWAATLYGRVDFGSPDFCTISVGGVFFDDSPHWASSGLGPPGVDCSVPLTLDYDSPLNELCDWPETLDVERTL